MSWAPPILEGGHQTRETSTPPNCQKMWPFFSMTTNFSLPSEQDERAWRTDGLPTTAQQYRATATREAQGAGSTPNGTKNLWGKFQHQTAKRNSPHELVPLRNPPCVPFRLVVLPLRGPGQSPVLPFACCVGSLRSVGRCGRCSCWCRFRVRGAQPPPWTTLSTVQQPLPRHIGPDVTHMIGQGCKKVLLCWLTGTARVSGRAATKPRPATFRNIFAGHAASRSVPKTTQQSAEALFTPTLSLSFTIQCTCHSISTPDVHCIFRIVFPTTACSTRCRTSATPRRTMVLTWSGPSARRSHLTHSTATARLPYNEPPHPPGHCGHSITYICQSENLVHTRSSVYCLRTARQELRSHLMKSKTPCMTRGGGGGCAPSQIRGGKFRCGKFRGAPWILCGNPPPESTMCSAGVREIRGEP